MLNPIELLRAVPAKVRFWLLITWTVAFLVATQFGPIWFSVDPRIVDTLQLLGVYLGVQSAANVNLEGSTFDPDAEG